MYFPNEIWCHVLKYCCTSRPLVLNFRLVSSQFNHIITCQIFADFLHQRMGSVRHPRSISDSFFTQYPLFLALKRSSSIAKNAKLIFDSPLLRRRIRARTAKLISQFSNQYPNYKIECRATTRSTCIKWPFDELILLNCKVMLNYTITSLPLLLEQYTSCSSETGKPTRLFDIYSLYESAVDPNVTSINAMLLYSGIPLLEEEFDPVSVPRPERLLFPFHSKKNTSELVFDVTELFSKKLHSYVIDQTFKQQFAKQRVFETMSYVLCTETVHHQLFNKTWYPNLRNINMAYVKKIAQLFISQSDCENEFVRHGVVYSKERWESGSKFNVVVLKIYATKFLFTRHHIVIEK